VATETNDRGGGFKTNGKKATEIDNPIANSTNGVSMFAKPKTATEAPSTSARPSVQGMGELQRMLNELALTRPEKLEEVKGVSSDFNYPSDELLKKIAHLMAIHFEG
jgi:hypothetical protein